METLGAFLDAVAARAPEREAVAYAPRDAVTARLTWAELRDASRVAARKLVGVGVGKGTRVGLLCSNRLEWLPIAFGALRIGAVLVPFSTLWKRDEIAYALTHADVGAAHRAAGLPEARLPGDAERHRARAATGTAPGSCGRRSARRCAACRRCWTGVAPGAERWDDLPEAVDDAFLDALERTVVADRLARRSSSPPAPPRRRRPSCTPRGARRPRGAASPSVSASRPTTRGGDTCRSSGAAASSSARWRRWPAVARIVLQETVDAGQRAGAARSRALHDHGGLAPGAVRCSSIPTSRSTRCT